MNNIIAVKKIQIISIDAPEAPKCKYLTRIENPDGTVAILGMDELNGPVFSTNIGPRMDENKVIESLLKLVK